jgi:hypothetical protein
MRELLLSKVNERIAQEEDMPEGADAENSMGMDGENSMGAT